VFQDHHNFDDLGGYETMYCGKYFKIGIQFGYQHGNLRGSVFHLQS
jgi:hypothetical protein